MSIQNQVEKQLQEEFEKFNNKPYSGKVSLPVNIIELFHIGIMGMPAFYHKIQFSKVKMLLGKELNSITNGDISDLIKVIVNTPIERFYDNIDEAVEKMIKLEKFILSYNQMVEEFKGQLEMKRTTLMDLSGLNGGAAVRSIIDKNI